MDDEEVCIYCEAETVDADTTGWIQEEFGWKCPECRTTQKDAAQPGGAAGMAGFGELMDVEKSGPAMPIEFDQQLRDDAGFGGSTDWEGPHPKEKP